MLVEEKAVVQGDAEYLDLWREWNSTTVTLIFGRDERDAERCLVPIRMTSDLFGFKANDCQDVPADLLRL